jgi:hypothetical protein
MALAAEWGGSMTEMLEHIFYGSMIGITAISLIGWLLSVVYASKSKEDF